MLERIVAWKEILRSDPPGYDACGICPVLKRVAEWEWRVSLFSGIEKMNRV
jgi:hypothetical protein